MTITTTTAKSGKINIYADGEYSFTVPAVYWFSCGVASGDDIDEEQFGRIKTEGEGLSAYDKALDLLSRRPHTKKELIRKLRLKFSAEASEAAVEKCAANGFVNDYEFAVLYAKELYERKNLSARAIAQKLYEKGIEREVAAEALNAIDIDGKSAIIKMLEKMRLPFPLCEKDKQKAVRKLLSAGYQMSDIRQCIDGIDYNYETE